MMMSGKEFATLMDAEFAAADTDASGLVDFDEFVLYYNQLIDRYAELS